MIIEIKAKYPIEWNREYYLVGSKEKSVFAPCVACDNKGRVEIKGEEYKCPRCQGNWREREVVSTTRVFHVEKYKLERIEVFAASYGMGRTRLRFKQNNTSGLNSNYVNVLDSNFDTMKLESCMSNRYLIDNYKEAMRLVKAANAIEKAKGTEVKHE